jgi:hypothetical protein
MMHVRPGARRERVRRACRRDTGERPKRLTAVAFVALAVTAATDQAQGAGSGFPADSPQAEVSQRLGFGEVTIEYSRPRVRGREIWGTLVPYGEVWRTGADYPTFVTTTETLWIEGEALPAGRYAPYTIPGRERWTIVFSRDTELWGAFGYRAEDDALRVEVVSRTAPFTESFTIELAEVRTATATLLLRWAELEVPVRLRAAVFERVAAELEAAESPDWGTWWRGARVALDCGGDLALARRWIDRSLALERNWMNLWTAGQLAAAGEDFSAAVLLGTEALERCLEAEPYCPYRGTYRRELRRWSAIAPAAGAARHP